MSTLYDAMTTDTSFDIPTHCKAGVVVNEGPDFTVQVETVPVPEPGGHLECVCMTVN